VLEHSTTPIVHFIGLGLQLWLFLSHHSKKQGLGLSWLRGLEAPDIPQPAQYDGAVTSGTCHPTDMITSL
jgi:hypothetical protein